MKIRQFFKIMNFNKNLMFFNIITGFKKNY